MPLNVVWSSLCETTGSAVVLNFAIIVLTTEFQSVYTREIGRASVAARGGGQNEGEQIRGPMGKRLERLCRTGAGGRGACAYRCTRMWARSSC